MLVRSSSSAAFLQGMGSTLALSSAVAPVDFSYVASATDMGMYWRHVGDYLYHGIETAQQEVDTSQHQLTLNLQFV